jgi:hypothetical protein
MDVVQEPADTTNAKYVSSATTSIQHVGLKIERRPGGGLTISNPKSVDALLRAHGLADANTAKMPYKVTADLTAAKDNDVLVPVKPYQELIGSLSFICDTTHPTISWIVGVLGRHLH